jgi:DNA repair exonuclease SbcCD ATPase subunit
MGYPISQIIGGALFAAAVGILIGYLLKQFLAGKAAEQLETMWSEKVRRASRELEALRTDLKAQVQRADDLERASDADRARLISAQNELAAEKERTASLVGELASKSTMIGALKDAAAGFKSTIDEGGKKVANLENTIRGKDQLIENLEAELAKARAESTTKDTSIETLSARIGELEPLTPRLAAATKAADDSAARYKALETTKNGQLASLKARIGELEPLQAKVKEWEARYTGMLKEKDSSLAKLTATVAALEPMKARVDATAKENAALTARLKDLEAAAAAKIQNLEQSLRARVPDIEPLERKLHVANEEVGKLRLRVHDLEAKLAEETKQAETFPLQNPQERDHSSENAEQDERLKTWDRRFSAMVHEKDAEISRLRIELGNLIPLREEVAALNSRLNEQAASAKDDLKKIFGIGPAVEKKLNGYGVFHFKQLALWNEQDIVEFERRLPEFQNRTARDKWVAGAKAEHLKKYGEQL